VKSERDKQIREFLRKLWRKQAWKSIVLIIFLIIAIGAYASGRSTAFTSEFNLNSLLLATLPLALVAMAQVFVLLVGDLDISVGAIMTTCVIIASTLITSDTDGSGIVLGVLAMLGAGIGIGIANAGLVHLIKIPSIIATLATLSILEGVALLVRPIPQGLINFDVMDMLTTSVGFVPVAFIGLLVLALLLDVWLHWSRQGLATRAVGYDQKSTRRLSTPEKRIRVRAFILSGFMAAVASLFLAAQVGVGDARVGSTFALSSIAAAVLGGTSLGGGRGSFTGAMMAALFLSLVTNVLPLIGLSSSYGLIIVGALTILGLILYQEDDLRALAKLTYKQLRRRFTATTDPLVKDYTLPVVHTVDPRSNSNGARPLAVHANGANGTGAKRRILIKGGTVITIDPNLGNFDKADVLVEDGKIAAVAPNLSTDDAEVIDASNMIVMPGFIDTHRHIWEGLLRNIGTDVPLEGRNSYMSHVLGRLAPSYRPVDAYIGNLVSALGALDAGITTLLDWSHIQASPDHTDAIIDSLHMSGMRAVFAYGFPWWGKWEPNQPGWFVRAAKTHFSTNHQLLTLALAPYGPEFTEFEISKSHWKLARDVGARISVHVGVGTFGKKHKLGEFGEAGLMGSDTTYIHCTTLADDEIQWIVDTGGTVSLAAPVEMMMGHGMVPTQKFLDRGLKPSLSVDVETNVPNDMFTQMRSVLALQRALIHNRATAGETNLPRLLTAYDALEFATIEGARANGLDHKTGSLTPGKEADIIMLRTDTINVMPVNDPIGAVVWGMDTSNVDSVFVAGKPMKRGGELCNVDLNRLRDLVYESRDHVIRRAGFRLPAI
jgi:cytosine/adenosine deaminase-related metal-dependent hydrolase/ribose/xylose/arabinose/galactoside ABC-type transport system permease subunit